MRQPKRARRRRELAGKVVGRAVVTFYHHMDRLVSSISRRMGVFVMTPYARNIGNCAEEIHYALLKARRDGTRALFLFPERVGWRIRVDVANRALEAVDSPFGSFSRGLFGRTAGRLLTLIFFAVGQTYLRAKALGRSAPMSSLRSWASSRNNIFYIIPSLGRARLWQADNVEEFSWAVVDACNWNRQYTDPLPVRLAPDAWASAHQSRLEMGLRSNRWFVCLHVREGGFHGDWTFGTERNSSIVNYVPAIRAITDAGGVVVRLGDSTMTPLPPMVDVIDYAHSPFKSELMDLYLISECRFYLGVNSGPLDVAWLFGKPVVLTNVTEWAITFARKPGDLIIFKHVFSRSRGRFLSLHELVDEPFEAQAFRALGSDYELVENTADEIRDVVLEYLATPRGRELTERQVAFNRARRAQIRTWLSAPGFRFVEDERDDLVERYRLAAHAEHSSGAVGLAYIDRFWSCDRTNPLSVHREVSVAEAV